MEEHWDETLLLAVSIRAGTVAASVMLRKLAGYPRQNPVARTLRGADRAAPKLIEDRTGRLRLRTERAPESKPSQINHPIPTAP